MSSPKFYAVSFLGLLLSLTLLLPPFQARDFHDGAQIPAPPLAWEDWESIGSCGGVEYLVAISKDDGRNDFELKIKINNQNNHTVQTRLNAAIESENGKTTHRENFGIGRLNGRRSVDACSTSKQAATLEADFDWYSRGWHCRLRSDRGSRLWICL